MRAARSFLCLAASALIAGCGGLPPPDAPTTRVSKDYIAAGDVLGVRAFVYGKRTVIEVPDGMRLLTIKDENGVSIRGEREGHYVRLPVKVDRFSLWFTTRTLLFTAQPVDRLAAPLAVAATASAALAPYDLLPPSTAAAAPPVPLVSIPPGEPDIAKASTSEQAGSDELLKLAAAQLDEVRSAIKSSTGNATESAALTAKLDRAEAQLVAAATVMVRVQFAIGQTRFDPTPDVARVLVPAALAAEHINVRGRTDARIATPIDPKLALGRALAARQFLVDHGVDAKKINVFAWGAREFIAPASTYQGRTLNRRVEIELINRRYAMLTRHASELAR